jgi:hypothetical protein
MIVPLLVFVVWLHGKAQIGDEGDDGLLRSLMGVESDSGFAFGIGRFAGGDAFLLTKQGVETGGAGNTGESLDLIHGRLGGCRGDGLERR